VVDASLAAGADAALQGIGIWSGYQYGFYWKEVLIYGAGGAIIGTAIRGVSASGITKYLRVSKWEPSKIQPLSIFRQTQPGETYYHYGYKAQAPSFEGGIKPGGYATPDPNLSGAGAQRMLKLPPGPPRDGIYPVQPKPGTAIIGPKPVPGGSGIEVIFPNGTGPGTVTGPGTIPSGPP
jgi:hypothetical protein